MNPLLFAVMMAVVLLGVGVAAAVLHGRRPHRIARLASYLFVSAGLMTPIWVYRVMDMPEGRRLPYDFQYFVSYVVILMVTRLGIDWFTGVIRRSFPTSA